MVKKLGSLKYLVDVHLRGKGRRIRIVRGNQQKAYSEAEKIKQEILREADAFSCFPLFSDVLDYYAKNHLKYRKSCYGCMVYVRRLKRDLGQVKVVDFTVERFRRYQRQELTGLKNATLNRLLSFSKAAFQFAVEDRKLPANPLAYTRKLRLPETQRSRILSDKEWKRLVPELPAYMRPITWYAYLVPTRKGELQNLRREWVDLEHQKVWLPGEATKTGTPRYLPIPQCMLHYFASVPVESEWVFYRKVRGEYRRVASMRADKEGFGNALKRAGIKNFRFHDLRHTAATNLRRKGNRIEVIMAIGGWKTLPTFFRYSNYSEEELLAPYQDTASHDLSTTFPQMSESGRKMAKLG